MVLNFSFNMCYLPLVLGNREEVAYGLSQVRNQSGSFIPGLDRCGPGVMVCTYTWMYLCVNMHDYMLIWGGGSDRRASLNATVLYPIS